MSHCDARVKIEVKNSLSQQIFQLFSKQVFFKFQDYGMGFGKKIFWRKKMFKVPVSQRDPKGRNSPLHVIREGRLSLFRSHGKGAGAWVSHCDTRVRIEVKHFLSQKFLEKLKNEIISIQFQNYIYMI